MSKIKITLPQCESIVNGKPITFKAPCNCEGVTAIVVGNKEFSLVNAAGVNISAIGNAFVKDAMVTVILDTDTEKAYIQNAAADRPLDTRPTQGSVNLVTSGGVKAYVDDSINTAIAALPPELNTTYTLTKSGGKIVLAGSDGSKTEVTDSDTVLDDTNTTYTLEKLGPSIKLIGSDATNISIYPDTLNSPAYVVSQEEVPQIRFESRDYDATLLVNEGQENQSSIYKLPEQDGVFVVTGQWNNGIAGTTTLPKQGLYEFRTSDGEQSHVSVMLNWDGMFPAKSAIFHYEDRDRQELLLAYVSVGSAGTVYLVQVRSDGGYNNMNGTFSYRLLGDK